MPVEMAGNFSSTMTAEAQRDFGGSGIFGIVDEGELSGDGLVDAGDAGDFGGGIGVFDSCADGFGDLGELHGIGPFCER